MNDDDEANFRRRVAVMRELGVSKCGDIELGPLPVAPADLMPLSEEEKRAHIRACIVERLRDLYAASGVRVPDAEIDRLVEIETRGAS